MLTWNNVSGHLYKKKLLETIWWMIALTWKKNLKYQLRSVAPRYTLINDLVYANHFTYLIAINVNTRKAYAIPSPLIRKQEDGSSGDSTTEHKDTNNVIDMLCEILKQTTIIMIVCDNERAFLSNDFKKYCSLLGIKIHIYVMNQIEGNTKGQTESRPVHGLLSILDRFCRTLRSMAYNIRILDQEIDPDMMNELITVYNNSPHTTFYRVFKRKITPNEMDKDEFL